MKKIIISDVTLRDGNHAVNHRINLNIIKKYCYFAEEAKMHVLEIGHGNGIGASSLSLGRSAVTDKRALITARKVLKKTKLSVHSIPGFSTLEDLKLAIDCGVDVIRVGCNSTDIDIISKQVEYCFKNKEIPWFRFFNEDGTYKSDENDDDADDYDYDEHEIIIFITITFIIIIKM
jgi:4-hydroxy 2-oxovalerate aldolase